MLLPRADKLLQDGENSPRQSSQTTGHSVGKRTRPRRVWLFGIISTAMVVLFLRGPSAKNIEVKKISDAPPGAFMLSSELEKTTPASTLSEIGTTNHFEHEVQNPNQETLPISPHRASHDVISMKSTEKARPTPITSAAAAAAAAKVETATIIDDKDKEKGKQEEISSAPHLKINTNTRRRGHEGNKQASMATTATTAADSPPPPPSYSTAEAELRRAVEKLKPCTFAHGRSPGHDRGQIAKNEILFRLRFSQVTFSYEPHSRRHLEQGETSPAGLSLPPHGDVCRPQQGAMTSNGKMKKTEKKDGQQQPDTPSPVESALNEAGLFGCPLTCLRVEEPPWCVNADGHADGLNDRHDKTINVGNDHDGTNVTSKGGSSSSRRSRSDSGKSRTVTAYLPCRLTKKGSVLKLKLAQEAFTKAASSAIQKEGAREIELAKQFTLPSSSQQQQKKEEESRGEDDADDATSAWKAKHFFACLDSGESYGAAWFATRHSVFRRRVSPGPREHMETAGSLGLPPANTPLKTVDLLDFSVEHLSWLERRIGLRYLTGSLKTALHEELTQHMRERERDARESALMKMSVEEARQRNQQPGSKVTGRRTSEKIKKGHIRPSQGVNNSSISDEINGKTGRQLLQQQGEDQHRRHLGENKDKEYDENNNKNANEDNGHADDEVGDDDDESSARNMVVAVFPYFATNDHCSETGAMIAKQQATATATTTGSRCDSGSSDPLMRRYFLNLTFWTVHKTITPNIVLSVCSDDDEDFARHLSGLPFYDVFRSECRIYSPEFSRVIFKPGLLGVLSVMRLQEHFRDDGRFKRFRFVYYNEADQVVHSRLSVTDLIRASTPTHSKGGKTKWPHPYVVPHRLQPISDPIDLPSLGSTKSGLAKWVFEDLGRVRVARRHHFPESEPPQRHRLLAPSPTSSSLSLTNSSSSASSTSGGHQYHNHQREVSAKGSEGAVATEAGTNAGAAGAIVVSTPGQGSCCLDRGECKTRKHWKAWKVPPATIASDPLNSEHLGVFKVGKSLTMVAGEGDYGNLLFRKCNPTTTRLEICP